MLKIPPVGGGLLAAHGLFTKHHLEFLSLKEAAQASLSLHLSKCHIAGNDSMSRLKYITMLQRPVSALVGLHYRIQKHDRPSV